MSIQHCDHCDIIVDTDYNVEHFDEDGNCEEETQDTIDDKIKQDISDSHYDPEDDDRE